MWNIVEKQNETFNGLGAGGEVFSNITNALTSAANSVANVTNSFANLKSSKNGTTNNANGGTNVIYTPPTTNTGGTNKNSVTDYLPWLLGGAVLLVGGYLIFKK